MRKLIGMLKVIYENLLFMHHNSAGPDWGQTHDMLSEYYEKISEIEDEVTEIAISLGISEPSIKDSVNMYVVLPENIKFNNRKAAEYCYNFFKDLMAEFESLKDEVPGDVYSKFEEYIFWLRLTAEYKIKSRLLREEKVEE